MLLERPPSSEDEQKQPNHNDAGLEAQEQALSVVEGRQVVEARG